MFQTRDERKRGPFLWWDFGLGILHLARACGQSNPANLGILHVILKSFTLTI